MNVLYDDLKILEEIGLKRIWAKILKENLNYKFNEELLEFPKNLNENSENNKYEWTHTFEEMLKTGREELYKAFWEMIKMDHPDRLMLRFLRARQWNAERAFVMLMNTVHWRRTFGVEDVLRHGDGDIMATDASLFLKQMQLGKSFIHGIDRKNRPICYIRTHLHRATDQPDVVVQRYIVWLMENARFMVTFPVETATVFFDLTKFSFKNIDYAPIKFLIKCFEAHYPESLGICIVHKAPLIFQGIWKIIKTWLDPVVVKKICFTNSHKELQMYIDDSQLIKELGGQNSWEYTYIEPVEKENTKMQDTVTREKLIQERNILIRAFETLTAKWIIEKDQKISNQLLHERNQVADDLCRNYWQLDPYIRARSLYDRIGAIPQKMNQ